jgi:hypothetical protein
VRLGVDPAVRRATERGAKDGEEAAARAEAQAAAAAGGGRWEAYDEDIEVGWCGGDDDDSSSSASGSDGDGDGDGDDELGDAGLRMTSSGRRSKNNPSPPAARSAAAQLHAAEQQLIKLEKSSSAAQALVLHTQALSDSVLKDAGVGKLKKGRRRRKLVEHHAGAYAQGKRDAAQIDLEQNALGDRSTLKGS